MSERYFTEDIHDGVARITGPDALHLTRVLRVKPGELLTLCDGHNTDYAAKVTAANKDEVLLEVLTSAPSKGEPALWAEVYISYARGERMEWAVQKSVELGASALHPFYSARCVVKPAGDAGKTARLARIAHEAAKQCGRGILPEVTAPCDFKEAVRRAVTTEKALFFYEEGGATLREVLGDPKTLSLITGPEGGFTPEEAAFAKAEGCAAIGLGPRILRSETAPAAALAAVMTLTGNLE